MDMLRATGDERLARQLWGDNYVWVQERQQFMPATTPAVEAPQVATEPAKRGRRREAKTEE